MSTALCKNSGPGGELLAGYEPCSVLNGYVGSPVDRDSPLTVAGPRDTVFAQHRLNG